MIFDRTELFSNAQPVTATTASTNIIDTGAPGTPLYGNTAFMRDLGKGTPLPLAIRVVQSFNNLTGLQINYQVADDAAFTQNVTTVGSSPTYTLAQVQQGAYPLQPQWVPDGSNRRYHRLLYTVTGTAPTTGAITAGFVAGNQTNTVL